MPPSQNFDPSALSILAFYSNNGGLARYTAVNGQIVSQEWICRVQGSWYFRRANISPDGRWVYMMFHADTVAIDLASHKWHWLARAKREDSGVITSLYELVWSPDSRFLLGGQIPAPITDLVLFSPSRSKPRLLAEGTILTFGWYPDSRAVWYAMKKSEQREAVWYKRALTRGAPQRLTAREQHTICSGWDFLPPAHRYFPLPECSVPYTPYTADRSMRVLNFHFADGTPALIETRQGKVYRLDPPSIVKHPTVRDISADKQWALVQCNDWEYYAVHLTTGQWRRVLGSLRWGDSLIRVQFAQSARLLGW